MIRKSCRKNEISMSLTFYAESKNNRKYSSSQDMVSEAEAFASQFPLYESQNYRFNNVICVQIIRRNAKRKSH